LRCLALRALTLVILCAVRAMLTGTKISLKLRSHGLMS
jgi:hypothetical protein